MLIMVIGCRIPFSNVYWILLNAGGSTHPRKDYDKEKDSLRFYFLGNNYKNKVIHIGTKKSFDVEGTII